MVGAAANRTLIRSASILLVDSELSMSSLMPVFSSSSPHNCFHAGNMIVQCMRMEACSELSDQFRSTVEEYGIISPRPVITADQFICGNFPRQGFDS